MLRVAVLGTILASVFLCAPSSAAVPGGLQQGLREPVAFQLEDCAIITRIDPVTYWFWDGYFGIDEIEDVDGERQGRLVFDPSTCFRISRELLEDSADRTSGYRDAVEELLKWLTDGTVAEQAPEAESAVRHLEMITGVVLEDDESWRSWWNENAEYVWWSEESGHLAVVDEAKTSRVPLQEDAIVLTAEEYWFYQGRGWIAEPEVRGGFVIGSLNIPPHGYRFRARAEDIEERSGKEAGYRRALDNLMVDGLRLGERKAALAMPIMAQLRRITDQDFAEPRAWVEWWEGNRPRLALSSDDQRLIVR